MLGGRQNAWCIPNPKRYLNLEDIACYWSNAEMLKNNGAIQKTLRAFSKYVVCIALLRYNVFYRSCQVYNMYVFSSVPCERRNIRFKMDIRHCFLGYTISRPHLAQRSLAHVVHLHALDHGLLLLNLGNKVKCKKRKRC